MRVYIVLLLFLASNLFATNFIHPDFGSCYKKNENLFIYREGLVAYPYKKDLAIIYSPDKKLKKFIKYDKFLGLYLVDSNNAKTLRFKKTDSISLGEWMGSADDSSLFAGNFAKKMSGLESNAQMASLNQENGVVMCLCCEVYGISTGNGGFIETEYIENFINKKDDNYGSFGVRFSKMGDKVYVSSIDPFCQNRTLELADEIVELDGKAVKNLSDLKREILFSSPNEKHKIKIKRDMKIIEITATTSKRFGGGLISDTYLERFGLIFDTDLSLIEADSFNLKVRDKLIQVDGVKVKTQRDVQEVLSKGTKNSRLLFVRDGFEFFVDIGEKEKQQSTRLKPENYGY